MNGGKELGHQIYIEILVELHDPENVQLSAHLKGFAKVLRVLLHSISVNGANINKEILLGLDHIKIDGKLKTVLERAVDQSGFLVHLIGIAATLFPKLLVGHLSHSLPLWLVGGSLRVLRRWRNTCGCTCWRRLGARGTTGWLRGAIAF